MNEARYGWRRDPTFSDKRRRLADVIMPTGKGLALMAASVAFLLIVWAITPRVLFLGPWDWGVLLALLVVYGALAAAGARFVGLREPDSDLTHREHIDDAAVYEAPGSSGQTSDRNATDTDDRKEEER